MARLFDVMGYVAVGGAFLFALALAASARGEGALIIADEKPSQFIWQTKDGTYTNLPMRHGDRVAKQFTPSRDRWTPVQRTAAVHSWAAAVKRRPEPSPAPSPSYSYAGCRDVYLGGISSGGGVTVCGDERATVFEQRVRQKGSLVTSTDTVITVDGAEVMRVRGRRAQHDPSQTVIE